MQSLSRLDAQGWCGVDYKKQDRRGTESVPRKMCKHVGGHRFCDMGMHSTQEVSLGPKLRHKATKDVNLGSLVQQGHILGPKKGHSSGPTCPF